MDNFKQYFITILWVAGGGIIGTLLRFGLESLLHPLLSDYSFFTATAFENVLGSFLMGFFFTKILSKTNPPENLMLFLLVGLLGSFTTYSGFSVEAFLLLQDSVWYFLGYIFSQVISGVFALLVGVKLAKSFMERG